MKAGLANEIYTRLKREIIYNKLHPGTRISELELCQQYNVSRTPVRQALQKLESLGLVEIRDGVGTFVTVINEDDVKYAYEIRCMVEKLAAKNAINSIDGDELERQEQIFLKIQSQLQKGGYGSSFEDMILADWQLHDLILEHSANPLLEKSVESITSLLRRCQFVYISQYERATKDHLEIIQCLKEKNLEGLYSVLERHLRFSPLV